jgi:TolB-like protein/Tfp pilus assembly protein PilF
MLTDADVADDGLKPAGSTVFLSYARADQKSALPIINMLEAAGYAVWWDGLLEPGERFSRTTEDALIRAKAVVVLWSKTSTASHWVHDEATQGRDRRCLVPISIDGSEAPLGFRQFQVIDVSKAKTTPQAPAYQAVLRAVAALHDRPFEVPPVAKIAAPAISRRVAIGGGVAVLATGGAAAWLTGLIGGSSVSATSVAVLPFANLSGDPAQVYFSDGLAAEIRSQLARNELLQVAAQASSNMFRERTDDARTISRKLRVAYYLDGNVRRAGDLVKVSAELVNGKTGTAEWEESFERPMANIFAVQSEIASRVASALSVEIDPTRQKDAGAKQLGGTKSVVAFDAYLRGKDLYDAGIDEASDRQALAKFEEAIAADSQYAAAHAARSRALSVIANIYAIGQERRNLYDAAVVAGKRAVALAPDFAEAHSALGFAIAFGQLNMKAARVSYERSYALGSGDADVLSRYAVFRSRFGEFGPANKAILHSSALDPLNARTFRSIGDINYGAGRYDEAIAGYEKALSLNPKLSGANGAIGFARLMQGKLVEAGKAFASEADKERQLIGAALVEHRKGNIAAADEALAELRASSGDRVLYQYAQIYAQRGDLDKAISELQQARAKDDSGLVMMYVDPLLEPLRKRPEFSSLLKSLGFV